MTKVEVDATTAAICTFSNASGHDYYATPTYWSASWQHEAASEKCPSSLLLQLAASHHMERTACLVS